MNQEKSYTVLILCTGNSARSILGEVLFNTLGKGKFRAYSAGSKPAGKVNPFSLELLQQRGHNIEGLRSKNWDEFAAPGAPDIDFIFRRREKHGKFVLKLRVIRQSYCSSFSSSRRRVVFGN